MEGTRINKYLSEVGFLLKTRGCLSGCKTGSGNGNIAEMGSRVVASDEVTVDHQPIVVTHIQEYTLLT